MKIYCLVGKSGTGKSFQAINICSEYNIESIIDDGLFIDSSAILAGKSAKRQATKIGAIKTALFTDDTHRDEVKDKIEEVKPESILVIGTSDKMINQIIGRLGLPKPEVRIDIDSHTTAEERKLAFRRRNELGQHIIPAPTFEVKRDFSGYFLHPLRVFKEMREGSSNLTERSVVRPTFSYLGKYAISDKAIIDIVEGSAFRIDSIDAVSSVFVSKRPTGINIDSGIIVITGNSILETAELFQQYIKKDIEDMTSINVLNISVEVRGLMWNVAAQPSQTVEKEENITQNG